VGKGETTEVIINLGTMAVDNKIGKKLNKIPNVDNVTKPTSKTAAGAAVDKAKDEVVKDVKGLQKQKK
jgi:hypothetical protein